MKKQSFVLKLKKDVVRNRELYILVLPAVALLILFAYVPMYGITLAFKEYNPLLGITGSPWAGFVHFERFFKGYYFGEVLLNTFLISLFSLIVGFIFPIIFALMLNNVESLRYKKTLQMISYAPYFISTVVLVAMIDSFFDRDGIINNFIHLFNPDKTINFLTSPEMFRPLYVWSGLWQALGWNSIIYISALSSVSPELYEAAVLDGATKVQRIYYIDLPSILPTVVTLLILSVGNILSVGFEKVYLMQNENNLETSEVISTYVYKKGLLSSDYGFGTAVGLFNSVINFIMLVAVNFIADKFSDYSVM